MDYKDRWPQQTRAPETGDAADQVPEALLPLKSFLEEEIKIAERAFNIAMTPYSDEERKRMEAAADAVGEELDPEVEHEFRTGLIGERGRALQSIRAVYKDFLGGRYKSVEKFLKDAVEGHDEHMEILEHAKIGIPASLQTRRDRYASMKELLGSYLKSK